MVCRFLIGYACTQHHLFFSFGNIFFYERNALGQHKTRRTKQKTFYCSLVNTSFQDEISSEPRSTIGSSRPPTRAGKICHSIHSSRHDIQNYALTSISHIQGLGPTMCAWLRLRRQIWGHYRWLYKNHSRCHLPGQVCGSHSVDEGRRKDKPPSFVVTAGLYHEKQ